MNKKNIIIAVTGASGSRYARLFARRLLDSGQAERVALIATDNARDVAAYEDSVEWFSWDGLTLYDNGDMFSPPASGSARFDAMVVIPCSMGMLGRIASGVSNDLISRAADVMLKERRPLVIVPRETPLNYIHVDNMRTLTMAGAVICPASPSFYAMPEDIDALCMSVVDRVLSLIGVEVDAYHWGEKK